MQKRIKARKPPRNRWFKRSDRIFLGLFLFLLLATIIVSHLPGSSQSPSPQALIPASSSLSSASSLPVSVSSLPASQGGLGGLETSQSANSNQYPNGTAGQTAAQQPQQAQAPNDNALTDDWLIGSDDHGLLAWTDPCYTIAKYCPVTFTIPGQQVIAQACALLKKTCPAPAPAPSAVQVGWNATILMANLFLVLFIMLNGIRVAMGGMGFRYADVLESLPRILLAFAAANLSQLFITELIMLNNALCLSLLTIARADDMIPLTLGLNIETFAGLGITLLIDLVGGILAATVGHFIPQVGTLLAGATLASFALGLLSFFVDISLLFLYLFLVIQLLIRIVIINFLTIMAPFGFACWALPQGAGQQLMRLWLNATFASIMVQFLQLICYVFGMFLFTPLLAFLEHTSFLGIPDFDSGIFCLLAILWFTLRIPGMLQNVATQMMGEASRNAASTISQVVGAGLSVVSTTAIVLR